GASGKTPGTDLREGVRTLPVLHALGSTQPQDSELQELLRGDLSDAQRHSRALELLRRSEAMTLSQEDLDEHAAAARKSLDPLPAGPAKAALEALCDAVISREG
ncbi:MAG TPA: polyprenyl synthetase family protein, partial [Actinomycetes bacterium]|nr:polyprenyl synthetase family protein [Actinomycetes bacterium]